MDAVRPTLKPEEIMEHHMYCHICKSLCMEEFIEVLCFIADNPFYDGGDYTDFVVYCSRCFDTFEFHIPVIWEGNVKKYKTN